MSSEEWDPRIQVPPYEGEEDFLFISYSHRDMDVVLPLLRRLREEGCRFWYDEGIDPGSEWPESIAAHLSRSRGCLVMMSPNSLASQNCRREINFALSRNKDLLTVILAPVEMSPGMEMQISTYQSILKYKYRDEEKFLEKLLKVEVVAACLRREEKAEPVPVPAAAAAAPPSPPAPPVRPAAPAEAPPAQEKAPERSGIRKKRGKAREKTPEKKRLNGKLLLAAAAVIVLAAALLLAKPWETRLKVGEQTYRDDSSSQRFEGVSLTAGQLERLARFKKCTALYFTDCDLDSGGLERLGDMEQLTILSMVDCRGVESMEFLNRLPALYSLTVSGCGLTDGQFPTLQTERLNDLDVSGGALTQIPSLANPGKVTELSLAGNPIGSLADLASWTGLRTVDVSGMGLTSLAGLEDHQEIRTLYAGDNQITDVEPLSDLIYLSTLDLKNNQVATLEPLAYCRQLATVSLRGNQGCGGLDVLSGSAETLTSLDLSGNSAVTSLTFLAGCAALTRLYAGDCALTSCEGLEGHAALTRLDLSGNQIADVSALADLPAMTYLNLADNLLTALPDLGTLGAEATSLTLVLSRNSLSGLSGLPALDTYHGLLLDGNPLTDISTLEGTGGSYLCFDCGENLPLAPLETTDFIWHYVTSVHLSQQAALEDILSSIHYAEPEDAFQTIVGSDADPKF